MTRWMLLSKKTGQLGNRLTVYAHCLAAARTRGYRLYNPAFVEYAPFFVGPRARIGACEQVPPADAPMPGMPMRNLAYLGARIAYKTAKVARFASFGRLQVARARNEVPLDLKEVLDTADRSHCRLLVLQGYHFRHHSWYGPHASFIREFLAPAEPWRSEGLAAVARLRQGGGPVVGVHIRHGDYAVHLGGRVFWQVPTYVGFMRRMQELLPDASFLVCSNAAHQAGDFAGLSWAPGPGHLVSDLQALAGCDYILGPPSSFSSWAAHFGATRLLRIEDPARSFALEDFRLLETPDPLY